MKKIGFTLAEILITLGVVGIVSALTIPSLITNNMEAQVGPKLAKAVTAFEEANKSLIEEQGVDALSDTSWLLNLRDLTNYYEELSKYLKISKVNDDWQMTKDGIYFSAKVDTVVPQNTTDPTYKQYIGWLKVGLDSSVPDGNIISGKNTFYFTWWNDGSLRPFGGTNWNNEPTGIDKPGGIEHWTYSCPIGKTPIEPMHCTGHIFENNLKILYR